ncbi:MAG: DNA alkylation repair protein [Clostridia bacterium]|nr:DNA alkylation repair protein [Clostridia bacterium]
MDILNELFLLADEKYRDFTANLTPTLPRDSFIGVRTPALRAFAKRLFGSADAADFMRALPHKYFEENNLHAFLICEIRNFEECVSELENFLPYVDNWATCDQMSPKVLKKHPDKVLKLAKKWIKSKHTYTVRYGIGMLMRYFLDDNFSDEYLALVASVRSEEYYIKMMQAWYFATALAKQYDAVLPYIKERRLKKWTHNKAIQKAIESYRITDEQKEYLRTLKHV